MGAVAPKFVGFVNEVEAEELFAEVAFVELSAKDDFVGRLKLREGESFFKKGRDGVGVGEFGDQTFASVGNNIDMVVGEVWEIIDIKECHMCAGIA